MEKYDLLAMSPEEIVTMMDEIFVKIEECSSPYKVLLKNGGTKRPVASICKLRLSYKRYRAKLKRETWLVGGKDELSDLWVE